MSRKTRTLAKLVRVRNTLRDRAAAVHRQKQQAAADAEAAHHGALEAVRQIDAEQELSADELERLGQVVAYTEHELQAANDTAEAAANALTEAGTRLRRSEILHERSNDADQAEQRRKEHRSNDDRASHRKGAA